MTGSLRIINNRYYIVLSYKNPISGKWCTTTRSTGLKVKNNKKKAIAMIPIILEQNHYLENPLATDLCFKNTNINQLPISFNNSDYVMFDEYIDHWLSQKKHLAPSTFEKYSYNVKKLHSYWHDHDIALQNITTLEIDEFLQYLLLYGKDNSKTHKKEPLAPRTVRDYRAVLCNIFNQCITEHLLQFNPVTEVPLNLSSIEIDEKYLFLSSTEIKNVLKYFDAELPNLYPYVFIGIFLGLRRSEILGLKWSAIDFVDKKIKIKATVTRVQSVHHNDATKSPNSYRTLAMSHSVEELLANIFKTQCEYKSFFKNSYKNEQNYVFTQPDGSLIDPDWLSKQVNKGFKQFGRPEISFHKLRHTCASLLIELNWNVKKVQYWLGHADVTTTLKIYTHYERHRQNLNVEAIDKVIETILN